MRFSKSNISKLIIAILICNLAGVIGSVFTISSIESWYANLNKPWFVPPNWLFAPAWTTLYTLMGISLYLVVSRGLDKPKVRTGVKIFGVQLALNSIWSIIFFGLRSPFYALLEVVVLWLAIVYTIIKFYRISRPAGLILVPYLAWTTFATLLNYYVWVLN